MASAQISDHALTSLVLDPAHSSVPGVGGQGGSYAFYCATAGSELFRCRLIFGCPTSRQGLVACRTCNSDCSNGTGAPWLGQTLHPEFYREA